jgi:hypothetical protein
MHELADYEQGQLIAAARAYLMVYDMLAQSPTLNVQVKQLLEISEYEMLRLLNNTMQLHEHWGSLHQLCCFIIFMYEDYVPIQPVYPV